MDNCVYLVVIDFPEGEEGEYEILGVYPNKDLAKQALNTEKISGNINAIEFGKIIKQKVSSKVNKPKQGIIYEYEGQLITNVSPFELHILQGGISSNSVDGTGIVFTNIYASGSSWDFKARVLYNGESFEEIKENIRKLVLQEMEYIKRELLYYNVYLDVRKIDSSSVHVIRVEYYGVDVTFSDKVAKSFIGKIIINFLSMMEHSLKSTIDRFLYSIMSDESLKRLEFDLDRELALKYRWYDSKNKDLSRGLYKLVTLDSCN